MANLKGSGIGGRKPKTTTPKVFWPVYIDEAVAQQVDLILLDPTKARVRYGARTALANQLFKKWIEDVQAGRVNLTELLNSLDN